MRTIGPAPVLDTPDWTRVFRNPLPLDEQRLLRAVETVLFKGTLVKVTAIQGKHIVQIETSEYPSKSPLFMDDRFLIPTKNPSPRPITCPCLATLLGKLRTYPRTKYIWGGNFPEGIPELAILYPMPPKVSSLTKMIWTLKGVDCSGLLWQVTNGHLPRNTSQLLEFGKSVSIIDRSAQQIADSLQPGDLLVWRGHVIIVEEDGTVFECAAPFGGTRRTRTLNRVQDIMETRTPVDDYADRSELLRFVVRRWHPDVLEPS